MVRARFIGLLLAGLPAAAVAAVGQGAIDDTLSRSSSGPRSVSSYACESANVLDRLSGCSALIGSGTVSGDALARAYRNRGMALFSLDETGKAIEDFGKAIDIAGGTAGLYLARGTAWLHLGENARALEDLLRTVELDPENAIAHGSLGAVWERLGNDARALEAYDRSLGLEPKNAIALNNRGNVLARMGRRRQAIADYDRALMLDPDYASAYFNRAGERCLEGLLEPAVADYLDAIRLGERHRAALRDFLSGQGYFAAAPDAASNAASNAASGATGGGDLESALRRWTEIACTPVPTLPAGSEGKDRVAAHPDDGAI